MGFGGRGNGKEVRMEAFGGGVQAEVVGMGFFFVE